jgi:hypothetical protein
VEFTAGAELKLKIERAANLMRHAHPSGDLSVLVERAVDLLLAKLEKQRLAKVARPRPPSRRSTRPGYVPRAVRRAVFERDGERCTFVDASGRRCESRTLLELDHGVPRARGGPDDARNLSVKCRAHNRLAAEEHFGREHVERKKKGRGQFGARDTGGDHPPADGSAGVPAIDDHPSVDGSAGARAIDDHPSVDGGAGAPAIDDHPPASDSFGPPASDAKLADAALELGKAGAGKQPQRHPRQRGWDGHDVAVRALRDMGFKAREARRALDVVERHRSSPPPSIETLLRRALAVLA